MNNWYWKPIYYTISHCQLAILKTQLEGHHKWNWKKKNKKKKKFFRIHPVGQPAFPALWWTLNRAKYNITPAWTRVLAIYMYY